MGVRKPTTTLRNVLCGMVLAAFPLSLVAANPGAAMLYAKGNTWLNGGAVPGSSAIFPGDMVQTKSDALAHINASGSSVMVLSDSMVKFQGDSVDLSHGGVSVTTEKGLSTRFDNVKVTPASTARTEFDVKDEDGTVMILARKGDVSIDDGSGSTTTLPQGQQTTRESATKKQRHGSGAAPAAGGGILDSPIIVAAGGAGIGALVTWVALQSSTPASPSKP